MARKSAAEVERELTTPVVRTEPVPPEAWLSSGISVLNLAASGKLTGFTPKGTYVYFVGDSSSGKTWFGMSLFAEAAHNKHFDNYRLVFDNVEHGALMDVPRFFGQVTADRIIPPRGTPDDPEFSGTIQEMFYNIDNHLDKGPCIYLLDSVDSLMADEDDEKFEEEKKAFEDDKEVTGSYGMAKPKYISRHINRVVKRLRENGSILILLSQTRDKVNSRFPGQKTRSGGHALKFYAHLELWTSIYKDIPRTVNDKERSIGSIISVDIEKNRLTGWKGDVLVPFYRTHGFDEVGACVDFLISEGHWTKAKNGQIVASDLGDRTATKEKLITSIQDNQEEREVQLAVGRVWKDIEERCAVNRKPRYS